MHKTVTLRLDEGKYVTNPVSNLGHHAAYLTLSYEKNDWTNSLLLSS